MKTFGKAKLVKGKWHVTAEPHVLLRLKRTFGSIGKEESGTVQITDSLDVCRDLAWFCERYPLKVTPADYLERRVSEHTERESLVERLLKGHHDPRKFELAFPPREYQQQAAELALATRGLLVGDDLGLGKTLVGICMLTDPRTRPALVVAPTHLQRQWRDEIKKFAPQLSVHILKQTTPYDYSAPKRFRDGQMSLISMHPDVLIVNYHKLHGWVETLGGVVKSVLGDEIHELRSGPPRGSGNTKRGSQKYVAFRGIADRAEFRIGTSATPIFNYGGEIYYILDALSPGALGDYEEFCRDHANYVGDKPSLKDPEAMGHELRARGLMLRRTRKDVGRELKPLTRVPHHVDCDTRAIDAIRSSAGELARIILGQSGRELERGEAFRAGGEFDAQLRAATGLAKAPYVAEFVKLLLETEEKVVLFGWHRACFAGGTPVLMHDGSTKSVERVVVGDVVMGPDSTGRRVTSLTPGRGKMFRVVPNKGEPFVCSEHHILALHRSERNCRPFVKMTAGEFHRLNARTQRGYSLYRRGVDSFSAEGRVLEPWLMGYWLGDGASNLRSYLRICSADDEIAEEARLVAARHGLTVRRYVCKRGTTKCCFFSLVNPKMGPGRNPLKSHFTRLGLHGNKHIPPSYKSAPLADRRELLAGIIDSDGHVYRGNGSGTAEVSSKWRHLAEDVAFVARSLGLAAYISQQRPTSGYALARRAPMYRVTISGDLTQLPMRIARKRPPKRNCQKNVLHTGFSVEELPSDDFFGFEVDGDHLFLLADFTVVHNCYDVWLDLLKEFSPVLYTGSESEKQKDDSKHAFIKGESRLLIISLRSGAGLDGLQYSGCRTLVFGELDWSPAAHEQCEGRIDRDGQPEPVVAYYLIADSGSDPVVADVLGVKRQQLEGLRDPDGQRGLARLDKGGAHVKRLAEEFLRRQGTPGRKTDHARAGAPAEGAMTDAL